MELHRQWASRGPYDGVRPVRAPPQHNPQGADWGGEHVGLLLRQQPHIHHELPAGGRGCLHQDQKRAEIKPNPNAVGSDDHRDHPGCHLRDGSG